MHIICCHSERFNLYDTETNTFVFQQSISLDALKQYTQTQYGKHASTLLSDRVKRARAVGQSSIDGGTLDDLLSNNRCGDYGARLYTKSCIVRFLS